ncbi:hypothetical protein F0562_007652 [Nyssa sinensis]|uniref:Uncharacterized protein n=1 Tax=Nyssa sinensis TaxID=561372 RepID=A0A5J5A8S9_9ASTE|nr:hypothetical protein F0562_007652 [Nyssa sinensis]
MVVETVGGAGGDGAAVAVQWFRWWYRLAVVAVGDDGEGVVGDGGRGCGGSVIMEVRWSSAVEWWLLERGEPFYLLHSGLPISPISFDGANPLDVFLAPKTSLTHSSPSPSISIFIWLSLEFFSPAVYDIVPYLIECCFCLF